MINNLKKENNHYFFSLTLILIFIFFIFYSLLVLTSILSLTIKESFLFSYFFLFFLMIFFIWQKSIPKFGLGSFFLYYFSALTFGFPLSYLIEPTYTLNNLIRERFLYGIYTDKYIGLMVLSLSVIVVTLLLTKKGEESLKSFQANTSNKNYYFILGFIFLSLYTFYLASNWLIGNVPTEYLAFKEWSNNQIHSYLKILFWFGCIFIIVSGNKKQIIISLVIFTVSAMILLITGNRNDVLYPLLIGIGIYVYRFKKVPFMLIGGVAFFIAIISPIISATRSEGVVLDNDFNIINLIASSLMELGSQIHSVSNMFLWLDNNEPLALGGTYIFATLALLVGIISPEIRDIYFQSRFSIETRLPGLAFAMPAEIYYNFSYIGIIIIYIFIAFYIKRKETKCLNTDQLVKYSFIMFILLHLVRNQFFFSATYFILFFIIYIFEKFMRSYKN